MGRGRGRGGIAPTSSETLHSTGPAGFELVRISGLKDCAVGLTAGGGEESPPVGAPQQLDSSLVGAIPRRLQGTVATRLD